VTAQIIARALSRVRRHAELRASPDPRVVVAIDPSERGSGVAVWQLVDLKPDARLLSCGAETILASTAIPLSWVGWGVERSAELLDELIGPAATWVGAVERPPPPKVGRRSAPVTAEHHWLEALTLLRRQRASRKRQRYRAHATLRPTPSVWRRGLGLPVAAPRSVRAPATTWSLSVGLDAPRPDPALWLKGQMIDRVTRLGIDLRQTGEDGVMVDGSEDHNEAEAVLIGLWATGHARMGWSSTSKGRPLRVEWSA
jgi:hypothetical protein